MLHLSNVFKCKTIHLYVLYVYNQNAFNVDPVPWKINSGILIGRVKIAACYA